MDKTKIVVESGAGAGMDFLALILSVGLVIAKYMGYLDISIYTALAPWLFIIGSFYGRACTVVYLLSVPSQRRRIDRRPPC
jgi:hypothetical protein